MESPISYYILNNWKLKVFAITASIFVWFLVNNTITETTTIRNVPIRIVNLPPKKTILGLKQNGYLGNRITLNLSGTKKVIDELEPGDLEVLLEGSSVEADEWNVKLSKNNLISLNPSVDLAHHIREVSHPEFTIKLSPIVSEKVPIYFQPPSGLPPAGYEFLDLWPQQLVQTMTGSQEEIESHRVHGLQLKFDLNQIRPEDLESLKGNDEVSYVVPNSWKKVAPVKGQYSVSEINDPEAKLMRITFLKKSLLPINRPIPIMVHYPQKTSAVLNPKSYPLEIGGNVGEEDGILIFTAPLYVKDVSRLFLDTVRDHLSIVISAVPSVDNKSLPWSLEVLNPKLLENIYVTAQLTEISAGKKTSAAFIAQNEPHLRKRFQQYLQSLSLFTSDGKPLEIRPVVGSNKIIVERSQ